MSEVTSPFTSFPYHGLEIAIVGMAGRFPGADSVAQLWHNLVAGLEAIHPLTPEFMAQQGATEDQLADPDWRGFGSPINNSDSFDAEFFGYSPREAELMDPQQRLVLESAWHALEDAGCDPKTFAGSIGMFAGVGMNGYQLQLYGNQRLRREVTPYEIYVGNDKDFICTRTSYKLGLTGPSLSVQTACSTSLVAVHLACQSLIAGECDLALAGGAALSRQRGYRAQSGGIYSADGHCRPFDAQASGTVPGNGVALVALKRLDEAVQQQDNIVAIIKGSAINNDGADKVSFTAPGVSAQAAVIQSAQQVAGVSPDSIGYIEAHGTGTPLGDPIEINALSQAFAGNGYNGGDNKCLIGSIKSNLGHLDAAAGVTGLIKAALCTKYGIIPQSLHYHQPNPQIDFANSPFKVAGEQSSWPTQQDQPRRAGVSSFGIGGTNAHLILEQAPTFGTAEPENATPQCLPLAAKSASALKTMASQLAQAMTANPELKLDAIAWTLQTGRQHFQQQRALVVADSSASAIEQLRYLAQQGAQPNGHSQTPGHAWLIPGQGSQLPAMAGQLYQQDPVIRRTLDQCAELLRPLLDQDIIALLCHQQTAQGESTEHLLQQTQLTQPLLFCFQYALAQRFMAWGFKPSALLGHSLGEWVAACLAGVISLPDALYVITRRAQLMQAAPTGAMLSLAADAANVQSWLPADCAIAAINGPALCVVAGPAADISKLQQRAQAEGVYQQALSTSHGFHSPAMATAAAGLLQTLAGVDLRPPTIPFISGVSGDWITPEQATDARYWQQQMLQPVQFAQGLNCITQRFHLLLEVGVGTTLSGLARQQLADHCHSISALPGKDPASYNQHQLLTAVGELWRHGAVCHWEKIHQGNRQRLSLPGYPFQPQRFWIDLEHDSAVEPKPQASPNQTQDLQPDPSQWSYRLGWEQTHLARPATKVERPPCWLLLLPVMAHNHQLQPLLKGLLAQIEQAGGNGFIATANPDAESFEQTDYRAFQFNPSQPDQYRQLRDALAERNTPADHLVDFRYALAAPEQSLLAEELLEPLVSMINVWSETPQVTHLTLVTRNACNVLGTEEVNPNQAAVQGLCQVAGQEYPQLGCRQIDLASDDFNPLDFWLDLQRDNPPSLSAWRHGQAWQQVVRPLTLPEPPKQRSKLIPGIKRQGRYLIIGDLVQGLGLHWAQAIADHCHGQLVLASTTSLAPEWLARLQQQRCEVVSLPVANLDPETIQQAYRSGCETGALPYDGVFISLPITNELATAPLALLTQEHWQFNRAQRVGLFQAVAEVIQELPARWCCVQSSMSVLLGGIGLGAYTAANHGLDAMVENQRLTATSSAGKVATQWFAMHWDATESELDAQPAAPTRHQELQQYALSADQVWTMTERVLANAPQGVTSISKSDLAARRAQWLHTRGDTTDPAQTEDGQSAYPRPNLATPYQAPSSPMEQSICALWQELLRLDQVGVNDSFFDLGGHSLLAIQAIGRLRQLYPVQLDLRELLDGNPTVANIARHIQSQLPDDNEMAAMQALMAEVEAMSDDDVDGLLAQEPSTGEPKP